MHPIEGWSLWKNGTSEVNVKVVQRKDDQMFIVAIQPVASNTGSVPGDLLTEIFKLFDVNHEKRDSFFVFNDDWVNGVKKWQNAM